MASVLFRCKLCEHVVDLPTPTLIECQFIRCEGCDAVVLVVEKDKLMLIAAAVQRAVNAKSRQPSNSSRSRSPKLILRKPGLA